MLNVTIHHNSQTFINKSSYQIKSIINLSSYMSSTSKIISIKALCVILFSNNTLTLDKYLISSSSSAVLVDLDQIWISCSMCGSDFEVRKLYTSLVKIIDKPYKYCKLSET